MRITEKDLTKLVERLNKLTNSPTTCMDENRVTNIGHFCLDYAYGGVQLQRVCNKAGGVSDVFNARYTSKKELYNLIHAFISGYEMAVAEGESSQTHTL